MKKSSQSKVKIKQVVKDTRSLFSKCMGVLFVYTLIFSFFREVIFLPISRKLWSLSLLTVKEGYISDHNFTDIFTHPLVLIAGLIAIIGYCILCLWETSGITMILEYSYRNQSIRFAAVIIESFKQITHCLQPKNWIIFVYLVVVQPLIDPDFAGQMMTSLTIPEYIMDFINARALLLLLLFAVSIVLFIFFIRYLFLPMIMILERKNYKEAAKKSVSYLKGRFVSTYIRIIIASIIGSFIFTIVPYIISYGLEFVLTFLFSKYEFAKAVGAYIFSDMGSLLLASLRTTFIKLFISAILLVVYHMFEKQLGMETKVVIPTECVKTDGKIFTFKKFVYSLYVVIFAIASLLFIGLVVTSEYDPQAVLEIVNPTKVAAHKGYSSKAPENTMPAFGLATNCDVVDFIELDVRETKDGIPVVIHDASILAGAGENILIYDLSYDELQKYSATYGHSEEEFKNTRFPTLDEVLAEYSGKKNFIIEIKASERTPELPKKIVDMMEKYDITETSLIHSGSYESLKAVKDINPDIKCGFIIAVSTGGYEDLPYADFFSVEHTYLSSNMIAQIHKRGKEVYVWTVNEKSSFEQVRNMGADAVITDYPEDAYAGIHQYDIDIMDRLADSLGVKSLDELEDMNNAPVDYNGTGD